MFYHEGAEPKEYDNNSRDQFFQRHTTPLTLEINAQVCTTHMQGCAMHATPISYHVVLYSTPMTKQ